MHNTDSVQAHRRLRLIFFTAFFLTGATGLIYQIIWSRLLIFSFGYSIHSISIVVTAFMAGLAIGSALGGRLADRLGSTVFAYGVAEAGIGVITLLSYPLLMKLPFFFSGLRDMFSIPFYGFNIWTFLVAMAILLPPTILMGATLPLLSKAITREGKDASLYIGGLYALNTLGAAIGSVACGFIMIAFLGVYSTLLIAAVINIIIGLFAIWYSFSGQRVLSPAIAPPQAGRERSKSILREPIVWTFGVSGFASLAAEIVWVRSFSPYLENSTYAFSLILGIYLVGIAAGGWAGRKAAARAGSHSLGFGACQILTGVFTGIGFLFLFLFVGHYSKILPNLGLIVSRPFILIEESVGIFLILIPATFFMGAGFPFIAQWAGSEFSKLGGRTGAVYAVNTAGSILGALAGGFLLLPVIGTTGSLVLLTALFMINGFVLVYGNIAPERKKAVAAAGVLFIVFAALLIRLPDPNVFAIEKGYSDTKIVLHREVPDVNLTLLDNGFGKILYINLREVSGTGSMLTSWMLHLPMLLQDKPPERLLNIGLGMGYSYSLALLHYPELKADVVELIPGVVDIYKEHNELYKDVAPAMADKRGQIIIADGRNYLISTKKTYDVVLIDPTPPLYSAGAVNLYTADFFRLVKSKMSQEGIFLLRIPVSADSDSIRLVMRALIEVFPNVDVWKPVRPGDPKAFLGLSILASSTEHKMDAEKLKARIAGLSVSDGWKEKLASTQPVYMGSGKDILKNYESIPLVTDDRPHLEFPLFNKF